MEMLDKQIRRLGGQQEAFINSGELSTLLKKELKSMLRFLNKKKLKFAQEVDRLAEEEFGDKIDMLATIPGIGKKTAIMLNLITDGFTKFEHHKQLIAYVGFSPRIFQSGTSVKGKGHICKMGKSQIRKLLYLCSWTAKLCNKACREMYERLKAKGKPERIIKIAIANKSLKQVFAIGKSQINYSENHADNICF
ncbi:MAG: transposase [Flavobacteriales bacterium]|jgi:transposase|tara:strand:- start:226 stop:807 length:582 start_codon:yes stop_codon:yes gene_type:complete